MFLRLPSFRATTCPPTRSISSLWPCVHDIEVAVRLFIENLVGHFEAVSQLEPKPFAAVSTDEWGRRCWAVEHRLALCDGVRWI